MLFSDIYGEVQTNFPSSYTARVKRWANWAQHDILSRYDWSFRESSATFTTIIGQDAYTIIGATPVIPDFAGQISWDVNISANATAYVPLAEMPQTIFDRLNIVTANGTPAIYTLRGGAAQTTSGAVRAGGAQTIEFFPTPDDTYTIRANYYRAADSVEMTADSDVPLVPVRLQPAIVMLATAIGFELENQADAAVPLRRAAEQIIAEAISQQQRMRRGGGTPSLDAAPTPAYPPQPAPQAAA